MTDNVTIKVESLTKVYHLYDKPQDRFKEALHPFRKSYHHDFYAVNNISFEIKKGESVGIIGKNGAGKSTLLKMITGVLTPTSGNIEINGKIASLLELGAGFNPEMTGLENIYLSGTLMGFSQKEMDSKIDAILEFADIGEFIDQPVKVYSSGMFARLAFAVISHVNADILIIDEALSVGDAFFVQKCMRFLREFMKEGTVLFVSHATGIVVNLCSKAILLNNGQVIKSGAPKDVTEHYLATLYESNQKIDGVTPPEPVNEVVKPTEYHDMREPLINASNLRNDIEIFQFKSGQKEFGTGAAKIVSVRLLEQGGAPLSWIVGGEDIILEIQCMAYKKIQSPIIGFQFKDSLGQVIFADNTFLAFEFNAIQVGEDKKIVAQFYFRFPILPSGDYSISAAIAEGTQKNHVQHHWANDLLMLKVHASSICHGLIGVPMRKIEINIS